MRKFVAEEVNYWKTNRRGYDHWLDNAKQEIESVGGKVVGSGQFSDYSTGKSGFVMSFTMEGHNFTIKWPVLNSKSGDDRSAMRQAATALYHDIKSTCVKAKFFGGKQAFLPHLHLPSGMTVIEVSSKELEEQLPSIMKQEQAVMLGDGS